MKTIFILLAQYDGMAVIPLEIVSRDYFSHLTPGKMLRKVTTGDIELPIVRMEASQKCAKGVHIQDLADYLDVRREAGHKEFQKMHGRPFAT